MDMIKTGDFLRSLRKAKGLTQEEVATRLILSPKTISRWESGLGLPDISIITDVALLYDVTVDEILKGQRNNKILKEETEKSNDKKVNNILINKITSKFNIYFYVAIGILSVFLITEVILCLLVNPIVAIVLMALGFIISIALIIFGNIDIKMHYSSIEEPNEVNNAYIHSLKFIRVKNLLFFDIAFIAFELNLIFLGFLFNMVDSGLICSLISLFAITISAYLIIRIFLIKNTIKENKEALANQICRMIGELPYKDYNVKEVGVSACGFVHQSFIKYMKNLNISDFDLKNIIERHYPDLNVTIKNDAACTALSEAIHGASKDYDSSFFITISSGIGGALVNQRKLVNLHFEIGHMFVEYKHNTYEVEQLLSGNGLVKLCLENNLNVENAGEFFSLVRRKNSLALNVLEIWKKKVAILIANLQMLFDVDVFVLSGGVMKSSDLFSDDLPQLANDMIIKFPLKPIKIVLAKFDQDAGLMGGACVAFNN